MSCRRHRTVVFTRVLALCVALVAGVLGIAAASEPPDKRIDAAVLALLPKDARWGLSLAIAHGGRVTYEKGYGYRDAGTPDRFIPDDRNYYGVPFAREARRRERADPRTIYAIGSVTRQFTAAALLLLAQAHKLDLDAPVGTYLPDFRDPQLTIRTLLNQRSGVADLNSLAFLERVRPLARRPNGALDEARIVREVAALPLHFKPGAQFEYSTSNYYLLGVIVERVARQPLGAYLASAFFRPLGMTRTAYATTAASDDVAVGYRLDVHRVMYRAYPWDLGWLGGAGAMTSTVEDLARWNIALIAHQVLQPASLAPMWNGIDAGPGQGSYAMGWVVDALGSHRYLWHNGEVGGFHALNVIFPQDDLALTILSNNQEARPEYYLPSIAALYFPVSGIDRILPHSGVVLVEASLAVAIGALAIAIVALMTLKRFLAFGIIAAVLALGIGLFLPPLVGFVWTGVAALIPSALYVLAVRFIPPKIVPPAARRPRSSRR